MNFIDMKNDLFNKTPTKKQYYGQRNFPSTGMNYV